MIRKQKRNKPQQKSLAPAGLIIPFPDTAGRNTSITVIPAGQSIFTQGERCDAVYYLQAGNAKVHVLSKSGREALVMLLGPGDFCGEGCLLDNARRIATVTALTDCTVERIEPAEVQRRLGRYPAFTKAFLAFLVTRNRRYLADLSHHHFHSTEQRLAMTLLSLANGRLKATLPRLSQEALAEMVGTTRPRVNMLLNKFRRLGMIEYSGKSADELIVHSALSAILGGK